MVFLFYSSWVSDSDRWTDIVPEVTRSPVDFGPMGVLVPAIIQLLFAIFQNFGVLVDNSWDCYMHVCEVFSAVSVRFIFLILCK